MLSDFAKPYIQASVPVLRAHGVAITNRFYKNLFESHPELSNLFNMGNQAQGLQQQSLAAAVFAYAANFEQAEALAPVVTRIAHKHASLGITPDHYPIVGEHLLGAIKEVLGEAATPELIQAWAEAYGVLANVLIDAEKNLYTTSGQTPGELTPMKVVEIIPHNKSVNSYRLQPLDSRVIATFVPGQYMSVAVTLPSGQRQLRQYSLSTAPGKNYLQITVKRELGENKPLGMVSNWIHENVKVNDVIHCSAPFGDFQIDTHANAPIVMLAAGVGVTPMVSALNHLVEIHAQQPIYFQYAVKKEEDILHKSDIDEARHKLPLLQTNIFIENESTQADVNIGRMHLKGISEAALKTGQIYLCGPDGFMKAQWDALLAAGVQPSQIHREVFGPDLLGHLHN